MKEHLHDINDELLVRYLLKETNAAENRLVASWIEAAPANQRYYEHFKLIWERSRELAGTSSVDPEMAWQRFQQRVSDERVASRGLVRKMGRRMSGWQAVAMLTGLVAIVAMIYYFSQQVRRDETVVLAATTSSQVDSLPDGSVITLNKHSSLSYGGNYNDRKRTVALRGEAFFSVVPDKQKPFVVKAGGVTVTVTGTSFNVRSVGGKTEVVVETGSVQVSNGHQVILLGPKEKVTIVHPDSTMTKEAQTDVLYRHYRDKTFVCDNTPLWKLIQALNEAYDANIVIESKEVAKKLYTSTFHNESLDGILHVICQTFDLTLVRTNSQIVLK